nr:hypothetical protein BaRGS_001777 [Batillaria attramentaria]
MGRHTQSSAKKLGRWYKGDNYVDNGNYSWRNMELFADYQKQMYNAEGTIKASSEGKPEYPESTPDGRSKTTYENENFFAPTGART